MSIQMLLRGNQSYPIQNKRELPVHKGLKFCMKEQYAMEKGKRSIYFCL